MKRYVIVGIAVVAILGIAISMALINNTALADKADDNGSFLLNATDSSSETETADEQTIEAAASAAGEVNEANVVGETAVAPNGPGDNFIDEDGDGICDTCGNTPGTGAGNGAGNFVDEDGDGICDDCGIAPGDGTGNQYGRQSANSGQSKTGNGGGNRRGGNGGQGNRGGQGASTP